MCISVANCKCEPLAFTVAFSNRILLPVHSHLSSLPLADLRRGESAEVSGLDAGSALGGAREDSELLFGRLRDLGFVNGARCEVVARMWLGGDPLVVRIGGSTFALRRIEAQAVRVRRLAEQPVAVAPKSTAAIA